MSEIFTDLLIPVVPHSKYMFKVKHHEKLMYVLVNYIDEIEFEELLSAVRRTFQFDLNQDVTIKDQANVQITNESFGYYMTVFIKDETILTAETNASIPCSLAIVSSTSNSTSNSASNSALSTTTTTSYTDSIYTDPKKFYLYYTKKDLLQYFKHQEKIVINGELLLQQFQNNEDIPKKERQQIINIAADHIMICKNNDPSTSDKLLWAECISDIFPKLRNIDDARKNYLLIYNPENNTGYLATRIKTLQRSHLKAAKVFQKTSPIPEEITEKELDTNTSIDNNYLIEVIEWMKSADTTTQKIDIIHKHKETFSTRQNLIKIGNAQTILEQFPKFLIIPELVDIDFDLAFNGKLDLFTKKFNNVLQTRICNLALTQNKLFKFGDFEKDFDSTIRSFFSLLVLLPPTSLGRGKSNKAKLCDCFKRIIIFHEVNQPLIDVISIIKIVNPENSPIIIASGISKNCISKYYVYVDEKFLSTNNTAIGALDAYLKIHFVLHIEFESNLRQLLKFISNYIFNIKTENITSQMRLINTAIFGDNL